MAKTPLGTQTDKILLALQRYNSLHGLVQQPGCSAGPEQPKTVRNQTRANADVRNRANVRNQGDKR